MNNIISVIIPVYNVERYLQQCLESVLNQSYNKLEVILIDDGSTDRSGEICDFYAKKDGRVRVIHQKNGGAACAKNTGLRIATGKYLSFVDSDDYLEVDAYQYMVQQMEIYNADMIQCSFRDIYVNKTVDRIGLENFQNFEVTDYLIRYTLDWTCGLLWDKLYKKELFKNIFFEEGHKIDDEFFTYQGVMNANRIIHSPIIVYNYRRRKSGVMASEALQKTILLDKLSYLDRRRKNIIERFPELRVTFDKHFLDILLILAFDSASSYDSLKKIKVMLNDYFQEKDHTPVKLKLRLKLLGLQLQREDSLLKRRIQEEYAVDTQYCE